MSGLEISALSSSAAAATPTPLQQMIASYKLIQTEPSLFTGVANFLAREIKDYRDPSKAEINFTSDLLDGLIAEDPVAITLAASKLGLVGMRVAEDPNLVIYRCPTISRFPVLLYWRFGTDVEPLVLEDPHNKSDLMFRLATDMILNKDFKARCMISNAASKSCADPQKVGKAPGQSSRNRADAAHSTATLFCMMVQMLLRKQGPSVAHMQIHGMIGSSNTFMLVKNGFSANFTSKYKSFPTEFSYALAEKFPLTTCNKISLATQNLPGVKNGKPYTIPRFEQNRAWFRNKGGNLNTWVEARVMNGGGTWQVGDEDRGLWVGIEFRTATFGMPNNNGQRKSIMEATALAIQRFKNSIKPSPVIPGYPGNNANLAAISTSSNANFAASAVMNDADLAIMTASEIEPTCHDELIDTDNEAVCPECTESETLLQFSTGPRRSKRLLETSAMEVDEDSIENAADTTASMVPDNAASSAPAKKKKKPR